MTTITLDGATIQRMKDLKEELKICDESGHTLGRFFPEKKIVSPYTHEELDEFEKDLSGRSLADILK